MNKEKQKLYSYAYAELHEILKHLHSSQMKLIPEDYIEYIDSHRDKDYEFNYDYRKGLLEQDIMVETKSLIVYLYKKYMAPESEAELWKKYDEYCEYTAKRQKYMRLREEEN